jgi:hypothetical protein
MPELKEKYLTDAKGNRIGVLLDVSDYRKVLEELEELEAFRAYDAAKASDGKALPFEEAVSEIEQNRR